MSERCGGPAGDGLRAALAGWRWRWPGCRRRRPHVAGAPARQPRRQRRPSAPAAPARPCPPDIVWQTNEEDPPIGSAAGAARRHAQRRRSGSYPLTFRLMGPNSNDAFAGWNRAVHDEFRARERHPVTDRFIPLMATHWAMQDDQRTLYFKLDRDARFSDGKPVTARDYVFTWQMMQLASTSSTPSTTATPSSTTSRSTPSTSYTLRIVGTKPSWRPLSDYAGLFPTPAHATVLDADWVKRTTNQPQVAVGPYVVKDLVRGESVTFERVPNWWGDGKRRFQRPVQLRPHPPARDPHRTAAGLPAPRRARHDGGHLGALVERGLQLPRRAQRLDPARPHHDRLARRACTACT